MDIIIHGVLCNYAESAVRFLAILCDSEVNSKIEIVGGREVTSPCSVTELETPMAWMLLNCKNSVRYHNYSLEFDKIAYYAEK